jgi:hypothetical protein
LRFCQRILMIFQICVGSMQSILHSSNLHYFQAFGLGDSSICWETIELTFVLQVMRERPRWPTSIWLEEFVKSLVLHNWRSLSEPYCEVIETDWERTKSLSPVKQINELQKQEQRSRKEKQSKLPSNESEARNAGHPQPLPKVQSPSSTHTPMRFSRT